jgi:hypothetical protein
LAPTQFAIHGLKPHHSALSVTRRPGVALVSEAIQFFGGTPIIFDEVNTGVPQALDQIGRAGST